MKKRADVVTVNDQKKRKGGNIESIYCNHTHSQMRVHLHFAENDTSAPEVLTQQLTNEYLGRYIRS